MAAAAITFGSYLTPVTPGHFSNQFWGIAAIVVLSVVNVLGVRDGGTMQNVLMVLRGGAILALIAVGLFVTHAVGAAPALAAAPLPASTALLAFAAAMIPVLYAYDGFQTARAFVDGELKDPKRTLPTGLIWGMVLVVVLYLGVTVAGLRTLGPAGLAASSAPALDIVQRGLGSAAGTLVAIAVALSTLGYLSNQVLTSPRIYYAMAADRTFFPAVAYVNPRTRAPVVAIALQGAVAIALAAWGRYDQILNYVVAMDFVYFALAGFALWRLPAPAGDRAIRVPGHPWTTGLFVAVSVAVVVETLVAFPQDTLIGFVLLLSSVPIYFAWVRWSGVTRTDA